MEEREKNPKTVSRKHHILKEPQDTMTWICDKRFFPLVCLQKCRHITQQTHPKTTWHSADPCSLPPDREKEGGEKKKMTAALDLTSNTGERVGKKEKVGGEKTVTSLLWQLAEGAWQMQCNFSVLPSFFPPSLRSIHLTLSVCFSRSSKTSAD